MSKISDSLYAFSKRLFKNVGLGNEKFFLAMGVAIAFSLLALTGFYIPTLITSINWILALATCGLAFVGISLLAEQEPAGMFIGLIAGIILGGIVFALSSSMLAIAPIVTLLLAVPNIIAAGSYLLAGVCTGIESVCARCFGKTDKHAINSFYDNYTSSQNTELKSIVPRTPPSTPVNVGAGKIFSIKTDRAEHQTGNQGTHYKHPLFSPALSENPTNENQANEKQNRNPFRSPFSQ